MNHVTAPLCIAALAATAGLAAGSMPPDTSAPGGSSAASAPAAGEAADCTNLDLTDGRGLDGGDISVALVLNGQLGDEAFFDSANRGAEAAAEAYGAEVSVIEAGLDPSGWEPALRSAVAGGEYDLVITGTVPMGDVLGPLAAEFPDQQFLFYDAALDAPNVHSITYAQNEGSYLAGVVAGSATISDAEGINADKTIGFVGGLDLPVINDFLAGYTQGAQSIDPDIEVLASYAGSMGDPAAGLELANAQIDDGADVIFQVAGGTGFGVFEAVEGRGVYAIGVDSNQNGLAPGSILTSVQKNVDLSLYRAIGDYIAGDLEFGETDTQGLADCGISLAVDEHYEELVPEDVRDQVADAAAQISTGELVVDTTLG